MCRGNWEIRGAKKAFELEGKTVGVIGLGAIGRETAKICRGCGMKIAGYDPFLSREQIEALGAQAYENYEDLLRAADIVTIHVPLTEQTRDMIAARQLAMMKPTALVINCSRGGIVNEKDLVAALKAGVIAGAGTDVYCNEPPKPDDPLLNCPNLIASPHSAAQTARADSDIPLVSDYNELDVREGLHCRLQRRKMAVCCRQICLRTLDLEGPLIGTVYEKSWTPSNSVTVPVVALRPRGLHSPYRTAHLWLLWHFPRCRHAGVLSDFFD